MKHHNILNKIDGMILLHYLGIAIQSFEEKCQDEPLEQR